MPLAKVLLIDDEIETLEALADALESRFDVVIQSHPDKVIHELESRAYDICVLDINMPHINGIELCQQIKDHPDIAHIPVIFLTALEDPDVLIRAFSAGGVDFLTKPVNLTELTLRIETHIHLSKIKRELLDQNIELNHKIQELSKQLSESQRLIEQTFQDRESGFSKNSVRFDKTRETIQKHSDRIQRFDEMLKKQEQLVKATKAQMGL